MYTTNGKFFADPEVVLEKEAPHPDTAAVSHPGSEVVQGLTEEGAAQDHKGDIGADPELQGGEVHDHQGDVPAVELQGDGGAAHRGDVVALPAGGGAEVPGGGESQGKEGICQGSKSKVRVKRHGKKVQKKEKGYCYKKKVKVRKQKTGEDQVD